MVKAAAPNIDISTPAKPTKQPAFPVRAPAHLSAPPEKKRVVRETKLHPLEARILSIAVKKTSQASEIAEHEGPDQGPSLSTVVAAMLRGKNDPKMNNVVVYRMRRLIAAGLIKVTGSGRKYAYYTPTAPGRAMNAQINGS